MQTDIVSRNALDKLTWVIFNCVCAIFHCTNVLDMQTQLDLLFYKLNSMFYRSRDCKIILSWHWMIPYSVLSYKPSHHHPQKLT